MPAALLPMTEADLDGVLAIEVAAYAQPWTRGNFVDSLAAGYLARLAVDEAGARLGYFVAMPGFEEMHLLNLTVAPAMQRRGLGQQMLRALCTESRRRGARALLLEVRESNSGGRRLYERFGFHELGLRRGYYPAGRGRREDAVVMRLVLGEGPDAMV